MSHQRIIGLIVLGCLFVLVLPFLSSEQEFDEVKSVDQEILVPEVINKNQASQEIMIEKFDSVAPATKPTAIGETSNLKAPAINSVDSLKADTNQNSSDDKPNKIVSPQKGWYVQIASLKESDPIAIESLKSSLRKIKVSIETENVTVKKTKFVRIKTKVLANKSAATKERDRINKSLAYDKIQAIVKKRR